MPKNTLEDMVPVKRIKREILKDSPLLNRSIKNKDLNNVPSSLNTSYASSVNSKMNTAAVQPSLLRPKDTNINDMPVNIPLTSNRRYTTYGEDGDCDIEVEERVRGGGSNRYGMWFIAIISILFLVFSISFLFTKATITIHPKTEDLVLNKNLTAMKDSQEGLSFDLVALSGEEEKIIKAGAEQDLEIKASGRVVIFNDFSTSPQSLNVDTRLESSKGKLYKTDAKVTVPGKSKDGTPGSIEVGIYAAEAGEEYNSGPEDFKIFGFKGTPKYEKFYARSKGNIAEGFKGKVRSVSAEDKLTVLNELKDSLKMKLSEKAINQIPEGFILFPDATFLTVDDEIINTHVAGDTVPVTLKGTLYGFLFKEEDLTKAITAVSVPGYDNSSTYIPDIKQFVFSLTNKVDSMKDIKNLNFNLTGTSKIIWEVDKNAIVSDLLGKSKKEFKTILEKYVNIDGAELVLRPVWRRSIPEEIKSINVVVKE
jgi:hypothetical protein